MSERKRVWNPIFHEYDYLDESEGDSVSEHEKCPKGGVHDDHEVGRSTFRPDGDPTWIQYRCKKCGRLEALT